MANKSLEKKTYEVIFGYKDPKTKHWLKVGDTVELTKPQAEPLLLGAKPRIKLATQTAVKTTAKTK